MLNFDVNEMLLDVVDQEKDLGVTMDKELTFRQHTDLIVSKANPRQSFTNHYEKVSLNVIQNTSKTNT